MGNLRERVYLEELGIDVRIILRRIFKWDGEHELGLCGSG